MKKVTKKLNLNKNVITNLNGIRGGDYPYTQDPNTICGNCVESLNPFDCQYNTQNCGGNSNACGTVGGGGGNGGGQTTAQGTYNCTATATVTCSEVSCHATLCQAV